MKTCENTLNGLLTPLMEEFHITSLCLSYFPGQVEVVAVMPQGEEGRNTPIGTLYRRLQESLGRRIHLHCVWHREGNNYSEGKDYSYA